MSLTRWPRSAAIVLSRASSLIGSLTDITMVFSPYFNASGRLGRLTFAGASVAVLLSFIALLCGGIHLEYLRLIHSGINTSIVPLPLLRI